MREVTLECCMMEVCPHCGSGSDIVINYVKTHDNNPIALYKEAIALSDYISGDFINILDGSDYNIFVPWYKAFLIYVKDNAETGSSWIAEDILDYYKDAFDKVEELCI